MHIEGIVIKGNNQAQKIGFPTANIKIDQKIEPGVYKGVTRFDGKTFLSAIYIGNYRPDILETHLIDISETDLYGKNIEIEIQEKIRGDLAGLTNEELKVQIASDVKEIIKLSKQKNV